MGWGDEQQWWEMVFDQPQVTYSHAALAALAESDAVLVVCGRNHLPVAVLLPLADHTQVVWRINEQLAISRPLKKQLCKQLIVAKIRGQTRNFEAGSGDQRRTVATNLEAGCQETRAEQWQRLI